MLLSIKNIRYTYQTADTVALHSVSLDVGENEYVAVLGANGSGKSTLARCIVGLLRVESGTIHIDLPACDASGGTSCRVPSALVFQAPSDQIIAETAELDIAFGLENLGIGRDTMKSLIPAALQTFALTELAQTASWSLTSGQKQHLALAGATVLNPAVLVLDEPTSMLSGSARLSVLAFLDRFHAEGGTILHITHDLAEAVRAGRIIVLDDGHLVFDGTPDALAGLSRESLEKWSLSGETPSKAETIRADSLTIEVEPVIGCKNLGFGPLHDFSFQALKGTVTAITGESGSGKSVLLELLSHLRAPDSGVVFLRPGETVTLAVQESEAGLFAEFVADDVAFGPRNCGLSGPALAERVRSAMDLAGLPFADFADRKTFSLSGGERRKAALAGIIAMDSSVVLLDEPSSALDTRSRGALMKFILSLKEAGKTVVFTTSRDEECEIADSVIALPLPDKSCLRGTKTTETKNLSPGQRSLEKLRHGASGAYVKLDTPVHRLSPVSKFILVSLCIACAVSVKGWPALVLLILLEFVPVALSRYPLKKLFVSILRILPLLLVLGVLWYALMPGNIMFVAFILRFIALLIPLSLFIFITAPTEIMYGMEDFLYPLRLFRLPVRDVSLVMGIVFRFITLLYEEALRISTARFIRGASGPRKKGLVGTVTSMASLFVPLVLRTLTRADTLAQAITARYYGAAKNTRYIHWKISTGERILMVAVPLCSALLIFLSFSLGK